MNYPIKGKHLIRVSTPCLTSSGAVSVTVELQGSTTASDVKRKVLKRFKPGLVDPNLFTISVLVEEGNTHSVYVLRDDEEIMRLHHLWQCGPVTYSLDTSVPIKVRIHTGKVFPNHVYKTLVIAEQTASLDVLRILLHNKRRLFPDNFVLIRKDLRDLSELAIKHSEPLGSYCQGPYAEIHLKQLKQLSVKWDERRLISFIDYDSPDEGAEEESSEQGSSEASDSSVLDYFAWISDAVYV